MDKEHDKTYRAWRESVKPVTDKLSPEEMEAFQEQSGEIALMKLMFTDCKKGSLERAVIEVLQRAVRRCDKERNLELLYNIAVLATRYLNYRQFTRPEPLKVLAQERMVWPVIKSTTTANTKQIEAFIKKISLGASPQSPFGKNANHGSQNIFQTWALAAYETISSHKDGSITNIVVPFLMTDPLYADDHAEVEGSFEVGRGRYYSTDELHKKCNALPELTPKSVDKWVIVVKYYLKLATKGHPEKDPKLRKAAGISRAKRNDAPLGKGTSEANIRDDIVTKVGNAFKNLVRKTP